MLSLAAHCDLAPIEDELEGRENTSADPINAQPASGKFGATMQWKLLHLLRWWCTSGSRLVGYMPAPNGQAALLGILAPSSTMNQTLPIFTKPWTVALDGRPHASSKRAVEGSSERGS